MKIAKKEPYLIEIRTQIVSLVLIGNMRPLDVAKLLDISFQSVYNIVKCAKDCGFNLTVNPCIDKCYIADLPHSDRPKIITEDVEKGIIDSITKDHCGCEKSAEYLAYEASISQSSVLSILKCHGFSKCKPIWKPGLTDEMKRK